MSDVASLRRLKPANAQLPVGWYFDQEVFALEKKLLFDAGPNYVGHELMVPKPGDYHTLAWKDHAQVLVRNAGGAELLSNVCRHRQSIMLQGRGNVASIVCPFHRWTYDMQGGLLGAPHFPDNPCVRLHSTPMKNWNGLLFAGPRDPAHDLGRLSLACDFDFSGYVLDRVTIEEYACNWKTFIEAYLEVYHVDAFHPGLGGFTDCAGFGVEFGDEYSLQIVPARAGLNRPGTAVYRKWHQACLKALDGREPKHGALWATYFPAMMLEWYPQVLVVSQLVPRGPRHTTHVVEFYYPEEIALFEREFIEAEQAAYAETGLEDRELCMRMDRGRKALWEQGLDDAGPYQSPMEDAMLHFHEWVRARLGRPALR